MKRRGFTLIELMVVIAIIIILAAIAIPNYLSMTARAKRSRVASDFASIATALETYKTDWNTYPTVASGPIITIGTGNGLGLLGAELSGNGSINNVSSSGTATAAGDMPPIEYMTATILKSMVNPYSPASGDQYTYIPTTTGVAGTIATGWTLSAPTKDKTSGKGFLRRTSDMPTVTDASTAS